MRRAGDFSYFHFLIHMRRFFLPPQNISGYTAFFDRSEAHHIHAVLRLRTGTEIEIFDGSGKLYHARLAEISSKKVLAEIIHTFENDRPDQPELFLAMAMLKGKNMDLVIQKATELGVHTLQPLFTRYCERKEQDGGQAQRRLRIILEACKQCGRVTPMNLAPAMEYNDFEPPMDAYKIMPYEQEQSSPFPTTLPATYRKACLLIGPEGGFHPSEVELAKQFGFLTVSLGPLILRAETAAI
ncbi:MAG: 16S rRNA (uracil(1498)-N(3))-methyltransferase, partial [Desulfobulbaceae bacterium]|nr:16S rRNA (uracil(1498)-N(3))-methyltransferase [Desulfobulbaceae bacterium]